MVTPRFSERIGAVTGHGLVQTDTISTELRNSLWNLIINLFSNDISHWQYLNRHSAQYFYKVPIDEIPYYPNRFREWAKNRFYALNWFQVYDFCEYIAHSYVRIVNTPRYLTDRIETRFNTIFEQENSGYRFISGTLVPITSPAEIAEIDEALQVTDSHTLYGAKTHLSTAISLLSQRPEPDYRNSIKESISAIEAIAKQLGTTDSRGLSGALDELGQRIPIHGALRAALLSLYGYTSSEGGIRHALSDEPNVGFDEAKFMLVVCSAFVNFLVAKAESVGLLRNA